MLRELLRSWPRFHFRDVLDVTGVGMIAVAVWLLHEPAGLATGGLGLIILATHGGRR